MGDMVMDEDYLSGEIRADAGGTAASDLPVKIGTELAKFGRKLAGLDLEIARDPMETEAAGFGYPSTAKSGLS